MGVKFGTSEGRT